MRYDKLKEIRDEFGFTCKQMGEKLNITAAYYCQIETGARNLSYNLACKIAKVFNMKPDEIFYQDHMKKRLK